MPVAKRAENSDLQAVSKLFCRLFESNRRLFDQQIVKTHNKSLLVMSSKNTSTQFYGKL
ncbi:hypothetical protein STSP2_03420 [Anaerohalosphaera lusitana]|uniref:Uncharacterized protein n=1 Tax=Anaerohalosphaera lusitana TaxID=1936003 RepID=A0A1U9NR42_9BACT|nr:hypothetical protein STSP2_03420 [Anaerohalosphaera lusitana]